MWRSLIKKGGVLSMLRAMGILVDDTHFESAMAGRLF